MNIYIILLIGLGCFLLGCAAGISSCREEIKDLGSEIRMSQRKIDKLNKQLEEQRKASIDDLR